MEDVSFFGEQNSFFRADSFEGLTIDFNGDSIFGMGDKIIDITGERSTRSGVCCEELDDDLVDDVGEGGLLEIEGGGEERDLTVADGE